MRAGSDDGSAHPPFLCLISLNLTPPTPPPPRTPTNPNCTHLLVLAPLRPKCDLCPDKGRWKRDCQTGRAGSEPLWGLLCDTVLEGPMNGILTCEEKPGVSLGSPAVCPLPTPGDSRRHGVTAVSGMLSGHWATFPSPCLRLCVWILPVLSTVCN